MNWQGVKDRQPLYTQVREKEQDQGRELETGQHKHGDIGLRTKE